MKRLALFLKPEFFQTEGGNRLICTALKNSVRTKNWNYKTAVNFLSYLMWIIRELDGWWNIKLCVPE